MKNQKTKQGICENCKDEYDIPPKTILYFVFGKWICGDCANEWVNEKREHTARYGENN